MATIFSEAAVFSASDILTLFIISKRVCLLLARICSRSSLALTMNWEVLPDVNTVLPGSAISTSLRSLSTSVPTTSLVLLAAAFFFLTPSA